LNSELKRLNSIVIVTLMILSTFSILTFAPTNLPIVHAAAPTPNVTLSVSTANVLDSTGASVYVTAIGSGFGPSEVVNLAFGLATGTLSTYTTGSFTFAAVKGGSIKAGALPAVATTDGLGWFKTQFAVPAVVAGLYNATFTGATSLETATAQLTVTASLVCTSHQVVNSAVSCSLTGAPNTIQATLELDVAKIGAFSQTPGDQWVGASGWTQVADPSKGYYTVTKAMPDTFGGAQTLNAVSGTTIEATTIITVDTSVVYSSAGGATNFVPTTPSARPGLGSKIAACFFGLPTGTTSVSGLKLNQAGGAASGTLVVGGITTVGFGTTGQGTNTPVSCTAPVTGLINPALSYVGLSDLVYTTNLGSATLSNAIILSNPSTAKDELMILQYAGGATNLNDTSLSVIGGTFNLYISGMNPAKDTWLILDNRTNPTAPYVWSNTTLTSDSNGANIAPFTVPKQVVANCGGKAGGKCGQRGTYYFTGWDSTADDVLQVGTILSLFINPAITYGWAAGYTVGGTATGQIDAGNGFAASDSAVKIYFGGTLLCTTTSNATGNLAGDVSGCSSPSIPKTAGPTANILYTDTVTLGGSATRSTGIFGNWSITPTAGPVGTSVAFTGEGFPAGTYDILWGAADQVPVSTVTTATAASSGITAGEVKGTFSVPNALGGVHITDLAPISTPTISSLYGATSNGLGTGSTSMYDASKPSISQFTVQSAMTALPLSVGKVGDLITVTYTGLTLGTDHYLWFNGGAGASVYTGQGVTGFSDLSGTASFTFAIPDVPVSSSTGFDTAAAIHDSTSAVSDTVTTTLAFTLFSSMTLSTSVSLPGTVVKAYAHGLKSASSYSIVWYLGAAVGGGNLFAGRAASPLLPSATANSTGQWTFTFPVPNVANGQYTVDLVAGTFTPATSTSILYFAGGGAPTFTVGAPLSGVGLAINQVFTSSATLGFEETTNIADNSGAGYMIAHRAGPKVVFTFNDVSPPTSRVNSATHQLTFSDYANAVVVGGHAANPTTGFYENASLAHLTAVVNANGTISIMHTPDGVSALNVPLSSITSSNDYFVLQSFQDGGHTVVVLWGIEQYGTLASGVYFDMQYSNLNNLTQGSYVIHWTDSNSNGIPDSSDTFTIAYYGT